jgi:hypothetical protein
MKVGVFSPTTLIYLALFLDTYCGIKRLKSGTDGFVIVYIKESLDWL